MKRLITDLKLKNNLVQQAKYKSNVEITVGVYTFQGDEESNEQCILISLNENYDEEIQVVEMENQIEDYEINPNLKKLALKLVDNLSKDFANVTYVESNSY